MRHIHRMDKLSKQQRETLLHDLVYALVHTNSVNESILFLQDLLTRAELTTLAKRLGVAKLLLKGHTYEYIQKSMRVSHGTIAKINAWLEERGDGFRKVIQKLPKQKESFKEIGDWGKLKRRYSLYFWPELLLEEIIRNANEKERERLKGILKTMDEKSELHERMEKLLKV